MASRTSGRCYTSGLKYYRSMCFVYNVLKLNKWGKRTSTEARALIGRAVTGGQRIAEKENKYNI